MLSKINRMSKRTIYITSAAELSVEHNQLHIKTEQQEDCLRSIEDLGAVIVDHHSTHLTVPLINLLSQNNVRVVFCNEQHMPVTMLMDLDSNVLQSKHFRAQLEAGKPLRKQLWKQIVERKIQNQSLLRRAVFFIILISNRSIMWVFVTMDFPTHTKAGRKNRNVFCNQLLKDGFVKLHKSFFCRHSSTLGNAEKHKKRVMGWVDANSNVSIFLIGDKQSEYAYYHTNNRVKKNAKEIMIIPEMIEFF